VRIISFTSSAENFTAARLGVWRDEQIADLTATGLPSSLEQLLALDDWRAGAEQAAAGAPLLDPGEVEIGAPLVAPPKILCLGMNFRAHAEEVDAEAPAEPTVFSKLASSITGPTDPIVIPAAAPRRVDYEGELAVVIGGRGRDVPVADAEALIAGYTVANDVSARDWQLKKPAGQWLLGKSFDTFLPLGPELVTADEAPEPEAMTLRCAIGDEILQEASIADLLVGIPEAISYLSAVCTLEPGDLILTGTPEGVGMARVPRRFLGAGDVVETSVGGIGTLRNPVVTADETERAQA
jgi:2-keto-4-pentenoate hydratase/2-oxohepta-3-ene-1,7-dioic acid hydratase in catechol pathway